MGPEHRPLDTSRSQARVKRGGEFFWIEEIETLGTFGSEARIEGRDGREWARSHGRSSELWLHLSIDQGQVGVKFLFCSVWRSEIIYLEEIFFPE